MALATLESIRDRILTLIEGLTPTSLNADKFRRHRAERDGDFATWAEKNPAACLRRFLVREIHTDDPPEVSSVTEEWVIQDLELRVAYPQTHRFGGNNALDRDDVINQDWKLINYTVGMYGRANFSSTNDCTPMAATRDFDRVPGVDFMIVRLRVRYARAIT